MVIASFGTFHLSAHNYFLCQPHPPLPQYNVDFSEGFRINNDFSLKMMLSMHHILCPKDSGILYFFSATTQYHYYFSVKYRQVTLHLFTLFLQMTQFKGKAESCLYSYLFRLWETLTKKPIYYYVTLDDFISPSTPYL